MREKAVKEQTALGFIAPEHQSGATNLSDLFTKEDKDENHCCSMVDAVQSKPPPIHSQFFSNSSLNLSDDHPETLSYLLPHFIRSSFKQCMTIVILIMKINLKLRRRIGSTRRPQRMIQMKKKKKNHHQSMPISISISISTTKLQMTTVSWLYITGY